MNAYKTLCHLLRDYSMVREDESALTIALQIKEAAQQLVVEAGLQDANNELQVEIPL